MQFESTLKVKLAELGCSLTTFARIAGWSVPRLSEIINGLRPIGSVETRYLQRVLDNMRSLDSEVRTHFGASVRIAWSPAIKEVLEAREAGSRDYVLGLKHPRPEPSVLSGPVPVPEDAVAGR